MIEVLIGNIASGKSTYCKDRAKQGALIVNDDSIVNSVHCNFYKLYDEKLKPLYKSLENQILLLGITLKRDVVIDRGINLTPKSRRRFIGIGHSLEVPVKAVIFKFEDPEVHAKRRKDENLRGYDYNYWVKVAQIMNNKYISPTIDEGFDELIYYDWSKNL